MLPACTLSSASNSNVWLYMVLVGHLVEYGDTHGPHKGPGKTAVVHSNQRSEKHGHVGAVSRPMTTDVNHDVRLVTS